MNTKDELDHLRKINQELLEVLKEITDCPYLVDQATVARLGIEFAPQQVVLNVSVGLLRYRKAEQAITLAKEKP